MKTQDGKSIYIGLKNEGWKFTSLNNKISLWNSKLKNRPTFIFKTKMFEGELGLKCLEKFYRYGFVIIKKTPPHKNSIIKLASSIGIIRSTNFGKLFNVKSVRKAKDLAYTSHSLSAHTDLSLIHI